MALDQHTVSRTCQESQAHTTHGTDSDVLPARRRADRLSARDVPREELLRAVRAAARDESVLSPR